MYISLAAGTEGFIDTFQFVPELPVTERTANLFWLLYHWYATILARRASPLLTLSSGVPSML
jgi:hypothetical protein